jgi:hypothetical protein
MSETQDIATHEEVLRILTEQARNGSVTAAAALARELRAAEKRESEVDDAIDSILAE